MENKKNQKFAIFSTIFLLCLITAITVGNNFHNSNEPLSDYSRTLLKTSATFNDIEIDALDTTNTSTSGNWTWAITNGICSGSGTLGSPYVIANHIFEYSVGSGDCLTILNSRNYFIIRECTFRNSGATQAGLLLSNTTNGEVTDCFSYNNYRGIELVSVNNTELNGNHIYNTSTGIFSSVSHFNTISNNNVSANTAMGIYLIQSNFNTISNNLVNDNQYGIYLDDGDNNTLLSNTANHNDIYGIYLWWQCDYNTISQNTMNFNGLSGLYLLVFCDNNKISYNTANFNDDHGFYIDTCESNELVQNNGNHNLGEGMRVFNSQDSIVNNNIAYNNSLNGISLILADNITLTDNTAYENKQNGIYGVNLDESVIENNNAHHNGYDGIIIEGGSQVNIIKSNLARYNNLSGIHVDSNNNLLMDNIASYNEEHGIFLESCNNVALTSNTANSNKENGIHLLDSNSNTIISNTANSNKNGTFLDNSDNNKVIDNIFVGNDDCYNETGSTGNIFEGNICTSVGGGLGIDLSTILLIVSIIEGVALAAIVAVFFLKRKRKS